MIQQPQRMVHRGKANESYDFDGGQKIIRKS